MPRRGVLALALGLLVLIAGCGSGGGQSAAPSPSPARTTPKPLPIKTPTTVTERCRVSGLRGDLVTFVEKGGRKLTGSVLGDGPDAAVLLHETGSGGLCGWVPYAAWLASEGARVVLLDWCSFGQSRCEGAGAEDAVAVLKDVIDWTRSKGATSVTVVGASMGGAQALGVGQQAGADAIVDLSGPAVWPGVPSAEEAGPGITAPLLLAIATDDRDMNPAALRAAFEAAPATTKRLIQPKTGHGWVLVGRQDGTAYQPSETGLVVRDWVLGNRG